MHGAPSSTPASTGLATDPAALVDAYLTILMKPDPEGARRFVAPELAIRFTGGRAMRDPAECAAFNASRYKWVRKRFEATEVVAGASDSHAVVYNRGTLYGEWLDGTPTAAPVLEGKSNAQQGPVIQVEPVAAPGTGRAP